MSLLVELDANSPLLKHWGIDKYPERRRMHTYRLVISTNGREAIFEPVQLELYLVHWGTECRLGAFLGEKEIDYAIEDESHDYSAVLRHLRDAGSVAFAVSGSVQWRIERAGI